MDQNPEMDQNPKNIFQSFVRKELLVNKKIIRACAMRTKLLTCHKKPRIACKTEGSI